MAANWKLLNRVWHANLGMAAGISLGVIALSCPFIAHKWEAGKFLEDIHYGKFLPKETRWIWIDSQGLLLGFLIVSGLLMHRKSVKKAASVAADDPAVAGSSVTVLGLGDPALAKALAAAAEQRGLRAFGCTASGFADLDLSQERWLVVTHGGAVETEALEAVLGHLGSVRGAALKRLEFAIEPGLEESIQDRMEKSLLRGAAKAMRHTPAPGGDWTGSILTHLCAQSPTLASRRRAAAAKPATAPAALEPTPAAGA